MLCVPLASPPVPTTSIYSKNDGVVWWQACLNPSSAKAENIGVHCGHLGIPMHMPAIVAVLDRLSQKEGGWRKFDARRYDADERHYFTPHRADLPENPRWPARKAKARPLFPQPG